MTFLEQCTKPPGRRCGHGQDDVGCAECKVRAFSVCSALKPDELDALDQISSVASFSPKSLLFDQGTVAGSVFNLIAGVVRLYKSLPDGRRQIVGFALPGDFLGLALMDRYGVTAEAVTPVKVCRFQRAAFLAFVDSKPHLLRRLHEFAGHELSLAQDQMLLLGRRTAEEKVAAFLLNLQARYGRIGAVSVTVPLPMNRQDIADYLGLTIETVSRTLTRMSRAKTVLIIPDGVRLMDTEYLEQLAAA